jgi:hypothetical protein
MHTIGKRDSTSYMVLTLASSVYWRSPFVMLTDVTYKSNDWKGHDGPFTLVYDEKPIDLQPVCLFKPSRDLYPGPLTTITSEMAISVTMSPALATYVEAERFRKYMVGPLGSVFW